MYVPAHVVELEHLMFLLHQTLTVHQMHVSIFEVAVSMYIRLQKDQGRHFRQSSRIQRFSRRHFDNVCECKSAFVRRYQKIGQFSGSVFIECMR